MTERAGVLPFTSLVGQDAMKQALLLNAVNPAIGGVLIRGEKGTAKSTAVRGLAALLPDVAVVAGCRFQCDPGAPALWCEECAARAQAGETLHSRVAADARGRAARQRQRGPGGRQHRRRGGDQAR